jgi:hypothetical protein
MLAMSKTGRRSQVAGNRRCLAAIHTAPQESIRSALRPKWAEMKEPKTLRHSRVKHG